MATKIFYKPLMHKMLRRQVCWSLPSGLPAGDAGNRVQLREAAGVPPFLPPALPERPETQGT